MLEPWRFGLMVIQPRSGTMGKPGPEVPEGEKKKCSS